MNLQALVSTEAFQTGRQATIGEDRSVYNSQLKQQDKDYPADFNNVLDGLLDDSESLSLETQTNELLLARQTDSEKLPFSGKLLPSGQLFEPSAGLNSLSQPLSTESELIYDGIPFTAVNSHAVELPKQVELSLQQLQNSKILSQNINYNFNENNGQLKNPVHLLIEQNIRNDKIDAESLERKNSDILNNQLFDLNQKSLGHQKFNIMDINILKNQGIKLLDNLGSQKSESQSNYNLSSIDINTTASINPSTSTNISDIRSIQQFGLSQALGNNQWSNDFTDRIRWLVSNNIQKAELTINPRNLGSIEISISLVNDQTTIHITTQNALVKETVESTMQRLREMFDDAGLNLSDVTVSEYSDSDKSKNDQTENNEDNSQEDDTSPLMKVTTTDIHTNNRLIDLYA